MGKNPVTVQDYELAADDAYHKSWLAYAGQWHNASVVRHYFVDDRLIVAITDDQENAFITCYHDHLHLPKTKHLRSENRKKPPRQRKQEYWDMLQKLVHQGMLTQFHALQGPNWADC